MRIRGIIRSGELVESRHDSNQVELILQLQGVGPAQPRRVVVPQEVLVREDWLDPDQVAGHGIEAEVELDGDGRYVVVEIQLGGGRVLREPDA